MKNILLLDSGSNFVQARLADPRYKDEVAALDVYDLPKSDLSPYIALLVPNLVDQEFLHLHRSVIRQFLDSGKVLVFSGHLFRPWLPGAASFVPRTIRGFRDYEVAIRQPHPIFEGVREEHMTYNKGVAGFFARGHHPAPSGAEVLLTLPDGEPIVYIDRHSCGGTLLVHAGNDLFGYSDPASTASRIGPQLLRWIRGEHERLQAGRAAV